MSDWKELPRPATPGPWYTVKPSPRVGIYQWSVDCIVGPEEDPEDEPVCSVERRRDGRDADDAIAIAALPEYLAEVDRLRAWLDCLTRIVVDDGTVEGIRSGAWPDGRQA